MKLLGLSILITLFISCNNDIKLQLISASSSPSLLSGVATPFFGSIVDNKFGYLINKVYAAVCANPVYARLYLINSNGTITEGNWISSQVLSADARYQFDMNALGLKLNANVNYLIKVEGCNGEIYKRPVTDIDDKQNTDFSTTLVADVVNVDTSGLTKNLGQASRQDVKNLMSGIVGGTKNLVFTSATTNGANISLFTTIFGVSPTVVSNAKPEVFLTPVTASLNELVVQPFSVQMFHPDPSYSAVYRWKLDGVVSNSSATWNYTPGKNSSGSHQIEIFVGKNDGGGNIDVTKPYYYKSFFVTVNNNFLPTAPAISLNAATPSPRATNSVQLNISTGASMGNCDSFSSMAITETNLVPSSMLFTYTCSTAGTQTENISYTATDGSKTLYIWARDNEGNISSASTVNLVYDATNPAIALDNVSTDLRGGQNYSVTWTSSDATTGISNISLYYAQDGVAFSLLSSAIATNAIAYSWTVPSHNTVLAKLKLVVTDAAGNFSTNISSAFVIDSTSPTAPTLARTSSANTNNTNVTMTVGSCTDTANILITETNSQPSAGAAGWQVCSTTASAITYTVTGQGSHPMYAWAKDAVGNVASSANTVSMILDTTNPVIVSGPTIAAAVAGGVSTNITWSVTDTNTTTIGLEYFNGASFVSVSTALTNNGTHSWTAASLNITNAKIRLTATDIAGNSAQATNADFTIDSINPTISAFTVASSVATVNTPTVSVQITAADGGSGLSQMRLSENIAYSNDSWQTFSTTAGSYSLSMTPGLKTIYIWAKDAAGNVSNSSNTTVTLDFGTPPVLAITGPSNVSTYANNDSLTITWSCSSASGFGANPIKEIAYTTNNGTSFTTIATNLTNNDSATTGHYDWNLPAGLVATPFRFWMKCESASGQQIEKMSDVYQTNGTWKIWAGQLSAKRDGILAYGANKMMLNACSTAAMDSSGNLFFTSATGGNITALMKINAVTGLIERMTGDYISGAVAAGEDLTSGALNSHKIVQKDCNGANTAIILGNSVDRSEILFLDNSNTAKIYGIKADGQTRLYTTFPFSVETKTYQRQGFFLSKNRILFIFNGGKLYRLDLSSPGNSPVWIYGTGSGTALVNITPGTEGTLAPLKASGTGGTGNTNCSDCIVLASPDGNRIWVGAGWGAAPGETGTNTWAQLDKNLGDGKYYVTAENITAFRTMYNAVATDFDGLIYARGRDISTTIKIFDPTTGTQLTSQNVDGYNGLTGGFIFNLFSSLTNIYMINTNQEIRIFNSALTTTSLIAGNNANKVGDTKSPSFVDFNVLYGLSYDSTSGLLAIGQSGNYRYYNFNDVPAAFYSGTRNPWIAYNITIKKGGSVVGNRNNVGYIPHFNVDLPSKNETGEGSVIGAGCSGCTVYTTIYDYEFQGGIPDGTLSSNGGKFFGLTSGTTGSSFTVVLLHSNGNYYFQANSTTNNYSFLYMYKAADSKIYKVAGKTGAAGYNIADNGTLALGSQLGTKVRYIYEIRNGAYAGDLLIVDGTMVRRISIVSEAGAPKIYDVVNFTLAAGFSVSTDLDNVYYDEASEIGGVTGTGRFYYVRTSPSLEIHKWKANDSGFAAATDTLYSPTGITLSGKYRLALTPDGLLVSEANQNRILRLPP